MNGLKLVVPLFFLFIAFGCTNPVQEPSISENDESTFLPEIDSNVQDPMLTFAEAQLERALQSHPDISAIKRIQATLVDTGIVEQGFTVKSKDNTIVIEATDKHGLMYGLFEVAELMELGKPLDNVDIQQQPFIKKRGLKFNVPLDARNPSYDDTGDSAQYNIETMWDFSFWEEYLDSMALHRYNHLTLWNPQPFTSLLKLEKYPGLALQDVHKATVPLTEKLAVWGEAGGVSQYVLDSTKAVKKLSIDEKIEFWKKVFAHAKHRGIDVHLITWSIYPNGIEGKYGITDDIDNPQTQAFFREAVKELIVTYEDLKGIGVTAGENIARDGTVENWSREKWLWTTYGLGLADAKRLNPDREVDFMHRYWYTSGLHSIESYWKDYPDHFAISFKYLMARMHSSPERSYLSQRVMPYLSKNPNTKTWWNLRNDDIFAHRWGDPEYALAMYQNMPLEVTEGIHIGSDGYVWARTFADKSPLMRDKLEIDKHWYNFMLWGRIAYNSGLDRSFFEAKLKHRFKTQQHKELYDAWATASKIVPLINRYQFKPGDRLFAPETCSSRESFRYVNDFQVATPLQGSKILNPRKYVRMSLENESTADFTTPHDVVGELAELADSSLKAVAKIREQKVSGELELVLNDIESMAHLANYYSDKIASSIALEHFDQTQQKQPHYDVAVSNIQSAKEHWDRYSKTYSSSYKPQMLARVGMLDPEKISSDVAYDLSIVQQKFALNLSMPTTHDPHNKLVIRRNTKVHNHDRLEVFTPDGGDFMIEIYEESGAFINNYSSFGTGRMRWEWLDRQKGTYFANVKWKDLNRIIKIEL